MAKERAETSTDYCATLPPPLVRCGNCAVLPRLADVTRSCLELELASCAGSAVSAVITPVLFPVDLSDIVFHFRVYINYVPNVCGNIDQRTTFVWTSLYI